MKILFLFAIILCCWQPSFSQKNSWAWAKFAKVEGWASNGKTTTTSDGDVYVLGAFSGNIKFGDSTYLSTGNQSMYIAKYDRNGVLKWSYAIGGSDVVSGTTIAVDLNGNVYVGGEYTKSIIVLDSEIISRGLKDMFILKFSKEGQLSWIRTYGTKYNDYVNKIAIDSKDNMIVGGSFSDTSIQFENFSLFSTTIAGGGQFFLLKYNISGSLQWAKKAISNSSNFLLDLSIDYKDNVYIVGLFDLATYFDGIQISSISSGPVSADNFIAKYDSSGNAIWAKAIGGYRPSGGTSIGDVYGEFITVDTAGNPIIGGNYIDCSVIFDKTDYSSKLSGGDMWMAKYSNSGNFIWSKNMGGGHLYDMETDHAGGIYLAGEYGNGAFFDTITLNNVPAGGPSGYNMFVAKYSDNGRVQWAETAGGTTGAGASGIAASKSGEVVVCGQFYGDTSIKFGNHTCYNHSTTATTSGNGFVAKLIPNKLGVNPQGMAAFEVFPNPAQDKLRIRQSQVGSTSSYSISNTLGQVVASGQLKALQEQEIALPDLPEGMYYLNIKSSQGSIPQKITIYH